MPPNSIEGDVHVPLLLFQKSLEEVNVRSSSPPFSRPTFDPPLIERIGHICGVGEDADQRGFCYDPKREDTRRQPVGQRIRSYASGGAGGRFGGSSLSGLGWVGGGLSGGSVSGSIGLGGAVTMNFLPAQRTDYVRRRLHSVDTVARGVFRV